MKRMLLNTSMFLLLMIFSVSVGMAYLNFASHMGFLPALNLSLHVKLAIPQHNPGLFQNSLLTGLVPIKQ